MQVFYQKGQVVIFRSNNYFKRILINPIIKCFNQNPGYDFVSDGLDSYKGNDVESLILRVNEILGDGASSITLI